ncbi:MAG: hypothetical protein Fur0018_04750 [Anaerolineales bacterium]
MKMVRFSLARVVVSLLFFGGLLLTACNLPASTQDAVESTQTQIAAQVTLMSQAMQRSADMTQQVLAAQATLLNQQATKNAEVATQSANLTQVALHVQQTLVAQALNGTSLPSPAAVSATPTAAQPSVTFTPVPPEPSTPAPPSLDERIRGADILLYENIVHDFLPRYVRDALDQAGYTYVDTGDASGQFKAHLLSGAHWDLIIASMESRNVAQGEFYRYLNDQLDQGAAVIIETWNLDDIAGGSAAPILERCGAVVQSDWNNPPLNARALWWLAPQNPIFHQPNNGFSLISPDVYWDGDAGDLLMLQASSDAVLLAGVTAGETRKAGTLISCMDGQLLIQTFSTHDYRYENIIALWQNYVYNTLKVHFFDAAAGQK